MSSHFILLCVLSDFGDNHAFVMYHCIWIILFFQFLGLSFLLKIGLVSCFLFFLLCLCNIIFVELSLATELTVKPCFLQTRNHKWAIGYLTKGYTCIAWCWLVHVPTYIALLYQHVCKCCGLNHSGLSLPGVPKMTTDARLQQCCWAT